MLKARFQNPLLEAGCDEAGRGCLAGPVFAAAVILPKNFKHPVLNDSKQLSHQVRLELRELILEKAISWSVAMVGNKEIDKINILNSSILAMHLALQRLDPKPKFLIIDGNRFKPYADLPHECIIKGDSKYYSIAAASILAKTYRDDYMIKLHTRFPHYRWDHNKGYPTEVHRKGIMEHGPSMYHRMTFRLLPDQQLNLEFSNKKIFTEHA
ncbi:MAG: ribonuclease HII [Bacteroidetes bacterium]|nr:ribonuclease HII [Bacteroidota bacterium]